MDATFLVKWIGKIYSSSYCAWSPNRPIGRRLLSLYSILPLLLVIFVLSLILVFFFLYLSFIANFCSTLSLLSFPHPFSRCLSNLIIWAFTIFVFMGSLNNSYSFITSSFLISIYFLFPKIRLSICLSNLFSLFVISLVKYNLGLAFIII